MPPPPPRQRYRVVSDQTWDLARAAYVSGLSARAVCEQYGLGEANLRKRARRDGWTKQAWRDARAVLDPQATPADPVAAPGPPPPEDGAPEGDVLDQVMARARAALTAGKGQEATALIRALRDYAVLAGEVAEARLEAAPSLRMWTGYNDDRVDEMREVLTLNALHLRWARTDPAAERERLSRLFGVAGDPDAAPSRVSRNAGDRGRQSG